MHGQEIEGTEAGGHQQDGDHGRAGCETHGQELVVDVVLVRQKGVLAVAHAVQHDPYDIQRGYEQHAEGHQYWRSADFCRRVAGVHAVPHCEEAEQVSQHQAARVSHKNLAATGSITEDVVGEEGNEHANADGGHEGVDPPVGMDEQSAKDSQGHHAQSGGQPVDTIDEVDGVGDEHHQHDGEGHAEERGHSIDAEEAVEVVDVQPGEGKHQRGEQLHGELLGIAHADKVVRHTHDVKQGEPGGEQQQFGGHARRQHIVHGTAQQHAQSDEEAHAEENDGEETQSAQAWYEVVVYLPFIGHIEESLAEGDQQDVGDDDLPEHNGGGQCGYNQS